jgi:pimeloyl-ACP methyl ester carboxylesterase
MTSKPRIGYAVLNEKARLHAPLRYLPIVIVPGIMGTRLTDPRTGELVWNPVGKPIGDGPQPFACNNERLAQTSSDLVPDETHGFEYDEDDKEKEIQGIKHYYNLVGDFYGALAKSLAALDCGQTGDYQLKPKVYCAGYDWRLDAAKSALRLAEVVEEALRETRERKVILVAHSMGGLVSRYYCRVLGGESRVHALILLASPTMGAPPAYTQLKHGPPGLYLKDILQAENTRDAVTEGIQQAAMHESSMANLLMLAQQNAAMAPGLANSKAKSEALKTRGKNSVVGLLGDMFLVLSLGAGRWLTRRETTYFARQMPAIYQLLPNSLYSREHKNWMIFDPLATGHPPTGYMILFPTLLDAATSLLGGVGNALSSATSKKGDKIKDAIDSFLNPEDAERTSGRTTRNVQTLEERIVSIVKALKNDNTGAPPGQEKSFLESEADAARQIIELFRRAQRSFIDCTNNRQVYNDIYTGLLDIIELRAVCASNLALFYRFDEALTVNPQIFEGTSPLDLLKGLLAPVLTPLGVNLAAIEGVVADGVSSFLSAVGGAIFTRSHTFGIEDRFAKNRADRGIDDAKKKARELRDAAEKARNKPLIYMHPNTLNVYGTTEEVEPGCVLLATDIVSNDDSNFLRMILIPQSLALALPSLAMSKDHSSGLLSQSFGDGTVPVASANPDPSLLSRPFVITKEVKYVLHCDLPKVEETITWVKEQIQGMLTGFLAT